MTTIFITGTDTGVGKTVVTALLNYWFNTNSTPCITQKWVQCGSLEEPDILIHDQWHSPIARSPEIKKARSPYQFMEPVSPHLASQLESTQIDANTLISATQELEAHAELVLIEGAGGLMVPIKNTETLLSPLKTLSAPVIIVTANRVGCINHTLLTIQALKDNRVPILGIVMTKLEPNENQRAMADNPKVINKITGVPILGSIPYLTDPLTIPQEIETIGAQLKEGICNHPIRSGNVVT